MVSGPTPPLTTTISYCVQAVLSSVQTSHATKSVEESSLHEAVTVFMYGAIKRDKLDRDIAGYRNIFVAIILITHNMPIACIVHSLTFLYTKYRY